MKEVKKDLWQSLRQGAILVGFGIGIHFFGAALMFTSIGLGIAVSSLALLIVSELYAKD